MVLFLDFLLCTSGTRYSIRVRNISMPKVENYGSLHQACSIVHLSLAKLKNFGAAPLGKHGAFGEHMLAFNHYFSKE